jgi:hypothetical protein
VSKECLAITVLKGSLMRPTGQSIPLLCCSTKDTSANMRPFNCTPIHTTSHLLILRCTLT